MDFSLLRWELIVTGIALAVLLLDLFVPSVKKRQLGQWAAAGLTLCLLASFFIGNGLPPNVNSAVTAYGLYLLDPLAIWAKQFFMLATALTILMSLRSADTQNENLAEYIFLQL